MSDRAAELTFSFGTFDVDVDTLPIAGAFSELIDPGLIDVDPVRGPEAVANEIFYIGERYFSLNTITLCRS